MKNKFIFLTGGVRSGKSDFAVKQAKTAGKNIVFIATCTPGDDEMKTRIKKHKRSRPKTWKTIEEPIDLIAALKKVPHDTDAVIIDCLTLLLSNLMIIGKTYNNIIAEIKKIGMELKNKNYSIIFVSNEVGSGIVPENKMARDFRDIAGKANQIMAKLSDEAYVLISGFPVKLKPRFCNKM